VKIYTGSGDRGKTSLFSGERVSKSDQRVEAYGDVDELNSFLGGLVGSLSLEDTELAEEIREIQSDLLHLGSWLALTPGSSVAIELEEIGQEQISNLEAAIDRIESGLPTLKDFLLPGGHISAVWAHVARAVCRRAERNVVRLLQESGENEASQQLGPVIIYLNRLSDYLFVVARQCNKFRGISDSIWRK
jgi:cob(I)alamin adenosyltransferase